MVCRACQGVLSRSSALVEKSTGNIRHHSNIESLRKAAEHEKCPICHSFWFHFSAEGRQTLTNNIEKYSELGTFGYLSNFLGNRKGTFVIFLARELHPVVGDYWYIEFGVYNERELGPMAGVTRLTSSTTGSPATSKLAVQWLEECITTHQACNHDSGRDTWNPSRLLDVRDSVAGKLRLIETNASPCALIYTTLSHKWGEGQLYKLTDSTDVQMKVGFPVSLLPRTFQHAVEVTRNLGCRYLWIDSLCIKQDDADDWLREASRMHMVYSHGYVNISTAAGMHSSQGLYAERDELANGFATVDAVLRDVDAPVRCIAFDPHLWTRNVIESPLNTRGWVLQERMLSRRILQFAEQQLFWECREFIAAETFPQGIPKEIYNDASMRRLDLLSSNTRSSRPSAERGKFPAYDVWNHIIWTYSRCSLTYPADKLPAIMGIAKQMSTIVKDTYVAGMWRSDLESQLLWHVDEHLPRSTPAHYRAPTWSWMSLDGEIEFPVRSDAWEPLAKVKDVQLDFATEDKLGPLTGGCLYLEGWLRPIRIEVKDYKHGQPRFAPMFNPELDTMLEEEEWSYSLHVDIPPQDNFEQDNQSGALFCMDLIYDDSYHWRDFLVLRCENRETGTYTRVGTFVIFDNRAEELLLAQPKLLEAPCVSWNADKGLHTICII